MRTQVGANRSVDCNWFLFAPASIIPSRITHDMFSLPWPVVIESSGFQPPTCNKRPSHKPATCLRVTPLKRFNYGDLQMRLRDGKRYGTGSVSDLSIDQRAS